MGVMIDEGALRRAEVAADLAEQRLDDSRLFDPEPIPAEQLAAMLTECMRSGSLRTPLPVPGWRDAFSRRHGPAPVAEIAGEEIGGSDDLMARVLAVVGRAMATDPDARAVVAEIAAKYGAFHGWK